MRPTGHFAAAGVLTLVAQAIAAPSQTTLVTADRSCGAAWVPNPTQAVHWARIDAAQGVLTVGPEIVARLAFSDERIEIRSRQHPMIGLPGAHAARGGSPEQLDVDARLQIDASCVLTIRGLVSEAPDSRLVDRAAAYSLWGSASDAERGDAPERAAQLAARAFDLVRAESASAFPQKLEFAAVAAEKLLQAGHRDQPSEILATATDAAAADPPEDHPSRLRFELARARALSFADSNEQALRLRLQLMPRVLAVFGPGSDESLWNRLRISNLRIELGDYGQARAELQALRETVNRDRRTDEALRISATRALATTLGYLDQEKEGVDVLGELRDELVAEHGESDARVIDIEEQTARIRIHLDQLEPALRAASRVFLWRMEHLGFSDVRTLQSSWTLALLYKELGRYDTARALVSALLEESGRAGAPIPKLLTLKTLAVLGNIEGAEGNFDAAEQILRSAWQGYATVAGDRSADTARALINYALLLVQNGRVEGACPLLRRTFVENPAGLRPDLQIKALSKVLLGLCLLSGSGDAGDARDGLADMEDGWNDLKNREGAGSHSAMHALSMLAWANQRYGDRSAAKRLLRDLVGLAERSRLATPSGSYTRNYWFSRWISDHSRNLGYRTLAFLHAQDGEIEEAIRVSELARDRRLRDRFFERDLLSAGLPAEAREKLRSMTFDIQALDEQLALDVGIVDRVRLESQRTLAVAARDELERSARQRYSLAAAQVEPPSLARVRALLPPETAVALIQRSGGRWWSALIVRDAPARIVMLDSEPDLDVAVRAWVSLLGGMPARAWPADAGRLMAGYQRPPLATGRPLSRDELSGRVGRAILAPLISAAPGARRFVIVADDELSGVPFGAMRVDGVAAVDRYDVSYAPSLGTYAALRRAAARQGWTRDLLSLAVDDAFDVATVLPDGAAAHFYGDSMRLALEYAARHPLPFASREVQAASKNFAPARTTLLRGSSASKATLLSASRDGSLAKYRYVHIAAHAFSFPGAPERSMLVLGGSAASGAGGRVLTAAELANLQMGSELLVLAGCATGVGRYEPGQGLLGFAFAALAAGNQAAVLALWDVADDSTQRFVSAFFERLRRGTGPSAALAATQREFAHDPDPRLSNPSTWAAFVLYGRF